MSIITEVKAPEVCPYCGGHVSLRESAVVYNGRDFGPIYLCDNWPACTARVGCHKGTTTPLGTLADDELRAARQRAHSHLDPLWKSGRYTRHEIYRRLSDYLGVVEAHVGSSDLETCNRIGQFCDQLKRSGK